MLDRLLDRLLEPFAMFSSESLNAMSDEGREIDLVTVRVICLLRCYRL